MNGREMIISVEEFLAHALAIEREAAIRYRDLADQLRTHHNTECAALFDRLAALEQEHADRLLQQVAGRSLPDIPPWSYRWEDAEAPESVPYDSMHYLMTPQHALQLALDNEKRAKAFFDREARAGANPEIRSLAAEFASEEAQHIEMVARLLAREKPLQSDWAFDADEPVEPE